MLRFASTSRHDEEFAAAGDGATSSRHRKTLVPIFIACCLLGGGCATTQKPDPLEPFNRKVFAFNEGLDKVVLRPTALAYKAVVPSPARTGISNFFSNLADPWSAANLI